MVGADDTIQATDAGTTQLTADETSVNIGQLSHEDEQQTPTKTLLRDTPASGVAETFDLVNAHDGGARTYKVEVGANQTQQTYTINRYWFVLLYLSIGYGGDTTMPEVRIDHIVSPTLSDLTNMTLSIDSDGIVS